MTTVVRRVSLGGEIMTAERAYNQQKYGLVPFHISDYPPPSPSSYENDQEHEQRIFKKVDEGIGEVPKEKLNDFIHLVDHLTKHLTTDTKKVRALFTWLGRQNVQDMKFPKNTDPNTPVGYLKRLKDDTSLYAFFFALMCREADVPCVILQGHSKAGDYEVGDKDSRFTLWNAVYVEEGWRLVHCNWAFVSVVSHNTIGWLKVEEDGQQMRVVYNKKDKEEPKHRLLIDDNYFFISPKVLSLLCLPEDKKWQLLRPEMSKERFFDYPFVTPLFSRCGFTFKRGQSGILNAKNGESSVEIVSSASWKGTLKYVLFYKKNMAHRFPNCDKTDRYVAMLNKNDKNEIRFIVRFPMEGNYILRLYQSNDQVFTRLCDFKFICDKRKQYCQPFPDTPFIGWGPGRESLEAELYQFSHKNGLIELQEQQKQKLEISFRFKGDQRITASLRHVLRPQEAIKDFLAMSVVKDIVRIRVDPDLGEFALVINSSVHGMGERNVLNYIIQCRQAKGERGIRRENALQRKVGRQHSVARSLSKMNGLRTSIPQFGKLGVEDNQQEDLDYLKARDGHGDAIRSQRVDELEKVTQQASKSPIRNKGQGEIVKAGKLIESHRKGFPPRTIIPSRTPFSIFPTNVQPIRSTKLSPKDMSALRVLRNLSKPVKEIMTATFLLLGENRWKLQDNNYLRSLVKQSGKDALLYRLSHFDSGQVKSTVVIDARRLLEQQEEEKLTVISPSVWKLYKEGLDLVEACSTGVSTRPYSRKSQVSADSGLDAGSLS